MPLLLHPDDRVIIEVLAFLNVLLESGNVYIQLGLKELMNSKEHPMLPTLKRMLRQASIAYSERCNYIMVYGNFLHGLVCGWGNH